MAVLGSQVSLDYFIQGFCLSSMTLRPSAFYAAAGLRTSALKVRDPCEIPPSDSPARLTRDSHEIPSKPPASLSSSRKGAIASAALRNLTRAVPGAVAADARPACLGEALDAIASGEAATVGRAIDGCQRELCGVTSCNLNQ